jgi:hypothetical protein
MLMTIRKYQKLGLLCISVSLAVSLSACSPAASTSEQGENLVEVTTGEQEESVEETSQEEISKVLTIKSEKLNEETEAYSVEIEVPIISGFENKEFEIQVNSDLTTGAADYASAIKTMALDIMEEGYLTSPYYAGVNYNVIRNDDLYLSIELVYNEYTGGAHGNYFSDVITYDVEEEKVITLKDIMKTDTDYMTVLEAAVLEAIEDKRATSEYGDALHSWYEGLDEETLTFSVQEEGLGIHFQPYEIGPYAEGAPSFLIPYDRLADVIAIKKS